MSKTVGALILVIIVAGSVGGYLYAQNMVDAYKEITFTLNSVKSEVITQDRFKLIFTITLDNPSNQELTIPETEFQVTIDEIPLSEGTLPKTTLPPNQPTQTTINLELSLEDLQTTALNTLYKQFILGEPTTIHIQGTIKAKALIQTIEIPFNKQIMDPEKPRLTIETSPKPSSNDEIVTITVTDLQGAPVTGSGIYMIPIIDSIRSENIIENGEHIGTTDNNGELSYQFTEPDIYALLATKPLEYRAAHTEHTVRILDVNGSEIIEEVIETVDEITDALDQLPYHIVLLTPLDHATTETSETTFQALVTQAGIPTDNMIVTLYINDTSAGTKITGVAGKASITAILNEGKSAWQMTVSKPLEEPILTISETRTITYSCPEIIITHESPNSGATITEDVVTLSIQVEEGLSFFDELRARFYLNGELVGNEQVGLLGARVTTHVESGEHDWYVELYEVDTLVSSSETWSFTVEIPVIVPEVFDFSFVVSPMSGSVSKGGSVDFTVTVNHVSGDSETVWLLASGLPSATKTFTVTNGIPSYSSTLTVDTNVMTLKGTHILTLTAHNEDWSQSKQIAISLEVT